MRRIVYLAGTIAGLSYEEATAARNRAKQQLVSHGWDVLDPMRGKELLSTLAVIDEEQATKLLGVTDAAIVQRDFDDVRRADVVLILSGDAPTWGTAFEWSLAHFHLQKPVVVVASLKSVVRNHPWCRVMASAFCETVEEAVAFISRWLDRGYALPDESESIQSVALQELRQFFEGTLVNTNSSGQYIVTDGVLYQEDFPLAFAALVE